MKNGKKRYLKGGSTTIPLHNVNNKKIGSIEVKDQKSLSSLKNAQFFNNSFDNYEKCELLNPAISNLNILKDIKSVKITKSLNSITFPENITYIPINESSIEPQVNNSTVLTQNYIDLWKSKLHLDFENMRLRYFHSISNSYVIYRWGEIKENDTSINKLQQFIGLNGKLFYDRNPNLNNNMQAKLIISAFNQMRREFLYSPDALNVGNKFFSLFYLALLEQNEQNLNSKYISYEYVNTHYNEQNKYHNDLKIKRNQYNQAIQHIASRPFNVNVYFAITLSMLAIMFQFLKTDNEYLIWIQNKLVIKNKSLFKKSIDKLIKDKVYSTYMFIANKGGGSQASDKHFNNMSTNVLVEGVNYVNLTDNELFNSMNFVFCNQCVLLHRNAVIDFIEFWRNGHNPGDESFPFGLPGLFEEDMQLQFFLYEQMKNNPNDKSYESRLIVPTKGNYTRTSKFKNYQNPIFEYPYTNQSSYTY